MNERNELTKKESWSVKKKLTMIILSVIMIFLVTGTLYVSIYSTPHNATTMAGSFIEVNATSESTGIVILGQFYPEASSDEIVLLVMVNSTPSGCIIFPSDGTGLAEWVNSPSNETVSYFTNNSQGGMFHAGDYIEFENLSSSTVYEFRVWNTYDDTFVSMTGDTGFFSTPPNPPDPEYLNGSSNMRADEYVDEYFPGVPDYNNFEFPDLPNQLVIAAFLIGIVVDLALMVFVAVKMK